MGRVGHRQVSGTRERGSGLSSSSTQPTRPDRGWFVAPFGKNPWWVYPASILPALLVTILIFMDQQITAVIVNRKENKLKVRLSQEHSCGRMEENIIPFKLWADGLSPPLVSLGERHMS